MQSIWSILWQIGQVLLDTIKSPSFFILYFLFFALLVWQYKRLQNLSRSLLGASKNTYLRSALISALFGLVGGIAGSVLLVFLGIDLSRIGITQLWLVAIILMLVQPRFICFAYAAGVLSVSHLLFNFPQISIPHLIGLVAVLHMVESLLILVSGSYSSVPVYVKKNGEIRGGFNLQIFWPIPLVAIIGATLPGYTASINMPNWWPIFGDYPLLAGENLYTLLPILAVLGYGEISTTRTPGETARRSALYLLFFSLTLLLLAILSSYWSFFLPLAAIFSPLGHEMVIWLGIREESNRKPLYVQTGLGVSVLDILPGTSAERAGLKPGDLIMAVNGVAVYSFHQLKVDLEGPAVQGVWLEILRGGKSLRLAWYPDPKREVGILPAPLEGSPRYLSLNDDRIFGLARKMWQWLKQRGNW